MEHSETPDIALDVTLFSLGEAAKEVGKSKTTISRAIKSGKISAEGNGDSGYKIQPCELFRVFKRVTPDTPLHSSEMDITRPPMGRGETLMLQAQLEAKSRECDLMEDRFVETKRMLESQLEDTRTDRDKWQQQARSTQLLLEYQPTTKKTPKRSYWPAILIVFLIIIAGSLLADRFGLISLLNPVTR